MQRRIFHAFVVITVAERKTSVIESSLRILHKRTRERLLPRGASSSTPRAEAMISVAHPDFHQELSKYAAEIFRAKPHKKDLSRIAENVI